MLPNQRAIQEKRDKENQSRRHATAGIKSALDKYVDSCATLNHDSSHATAHFEREVSFDAFMTALDTYLGKNT